MSVYRPLYAGETYQYQEHLLRLDAESRETRFSAATTDATIRRYCQNIDWRSTKIIGFFRDGVLRGAAEIRYAPVLMPDEAELAFSIERSFQSSRVGTNLMARSLVHLRNRGVTKGHVVCLLANSRMQKLALKYRADIKVSHGDVFMTINVPYGDISSLLSEFTDGYMGLMNIGLEIAMTLPSTVIIDSLVPLIGTEKATLPQTKRAA